MKCKFGIVSIMLAGLALTATAQTKEKYYSEKFKDNIFISAGVGAQACVNPDNFDYGFGHAITPLIHVSVGKCSILSGEFADKLPDYGRHCIQSADK